MALPVRGGGPVSDSAFSRRNISLRQTPHCLGAVRVRIFPQTQGTDHLLATCTQRGYAEGRGQCFRDGLVRERAAPSHCRCERWKAGFIPVEPGRYDPRASVPFSLEVAASGPSQEPFPNDIPAFAGRIGHGSSVNRRTLPCSPARWRRLLRVGLSEKGNGPARLRGHFPNQSLLSQSERGDRRPVRG